MMDELQLEKYLIREALQNFVNVFEDCVLDDKEWRSDVETATGLNHVTIVAHKPDCAWLLAREG